MSFNSLSIKAKFRILFTAILVLLAIMSSYSIVQSHSISTQTDSVDKVLVPNLEQVGEITALFKDVRIATLKYIIATQDERKAVFNFYKSSVEQARAKIKELEKKVPNQEALFDRIEQSIQQFDTIYMQELYPIDAKDIEAMVKIQSNKLVPICTDFDKALTELEKLQEEYSHETMNEMKETVSPVKMSILAAIAIIASGLMMWNLSNYITTRLRKLGAVSKQMAAGDLTVEIEHEGNDEITVLADNIRSLTNCLKETVNNMVENSSTLSDSSIVLKNANITISQASDAVLSQVITVSTAAEEMVSVSGDIAQNCSLAATRSDETHAITQESMELVKHTVDSILQHSQKTQEDAEIIKKLGEQTQKIDGILATIQDIASQTNLLALNAAIEAARAGEHGRGFAVVADEVRALASRTSDSTKVISDMISGVQHDVQKASTSIHQTVNEMETIAHNAEQVQSTLENISAKIDEFNSQIRQIATATEEQTATSQEMSSNMQKINEFAQNMSEQAKGALSSAGGIEDLSLEIMDSTHKFKLNNNDTIGDAKDTVLFNTDKA